MNHRLRKTVYLCGDKNTNELSIFNCQFSNGEYRIFIRCVFMNPAVIYFMLLFIKMVQQSIYQVSFFATTLQQATGIVCGIVPGRFRF